MLPPGGANLFQDIKKKTRAAEERGVKIFPLTIGQPKGPALETARLAASEAVLSDQESMHEYQDNGSPGIENFARDFINLHQYSGPLRDGLAYLPTPGTKSMLGLIPMACGHIGTVQWGGQQPPFNEILVGTMTNPGYPTPAVLCTYLRTPQYALNTTPENKFIFSASDIRPGTTLLMVNFPHNPTGQIASEMFWQELCAHCVNHGIRLFNDSAYSSLAYDHDAVTLAEVAQNFPDLSWCEAYSASKLIANATGWRIGAMVGSPDFMGDIATIKGNWDSGFFAPAAIGVLECLKSDIASIDAVGDQYHARNLLLMELLSAAGMKLAVKPRAGFFSLWLAPKEAFGVPIKDAEHFNDLMIDNTGFPGVPFGKYIRYSVTAPIEDPEWDNAIKEGFKNATAKY